MDDLDPHWEWHEVTMVGDIERLYVKGRCNHLETVPVDLTVTGEHVARLCLTCDAQLDASPEVPSLIISFPGMLAEQDVAQLRERFRQAVTAQPPAIAREGDRHG